MEVVGDFGIEGSWHLLLAKKESASCWATVRICKVATSFSVGPWQCGGFLGLAGHGSDG